MCCPNPIGCTARLLVGFGILYLFAAIIYAVIQIVQIEQATDFDVSSSKALWNYWYYVYPVLIGVWTEITGAVGICASKKTSPNTCKTCTFSQFLLLLVGALGYLLFDFTFYFLKSLHNIDKELCDTPNKKITSNCYVKIVLECSIISLGGIIVLIDLWCIVFCCSLICCGKQRVEPGTISEEGLEQRTHRPRTQEDQPTVEQPINAGIPQPIPTAPMLDEGLIMPNENIPYNPHWPPVLNNTRPQTSGNTCAGYQQSDGPPPYSEFPESGPSDAIIIDRETSQAYFIRPMHRGRLPPINS